MFEESNEITMLREEVAQMRRELNAIRGRSRRHRYIGVGAVALLCLAPALSIAGGKKHLLIQDKSTGQAVEISPDGCLLYTSPSPRDGLLSRMPSSA